MAMTMDTATVTATESPAEAPVKRSGLSHANHLQGLSQKLEPLEPIRTRMKKKYRHVAAVHSKPRTSCLSHDSEVAPSFLGFRNLMVIVLSMSAKRSLSLHARILTSAISCWESAIDD
jgi:diacylglycerol O-acyltransferase-1